MDYDTLRCEIDQRILTITLNRPDKLNALTDTMLRELDDAFSQAEADDAIHVIILTGAERGFCPGQDLVVALAQAASGALRYGEHLRALYNPLILRMRRLPKIIIGAINGVAAGAGMSLALACDLRIAAESASFMQAFVKVGLAPDSGSSWLLPRLVGPARALELMLSGRRVSAQEALTLGIVNEVTPDSDLMRRTMELASELANGPTITIGYIKSAVEFALDHALAEALDKEAELQDLAGQTADHIEGVSAFLEKRPPQFRGK